MRVVIKGVSIDGREGFICCEKTFDPSTQTANIKTWLFKGIFSGFYPLKQRKSSIPIQYNKIFTSLSAIHTTEKDWEEKLTEYLKTILN